MAQRGRPRAFDREAALAKALELFWRHGYEGVSVADLTAAMGINSPSLYAAFGSKEQLFRDAVDLYLKNYGGFVARILADAPTARAALQSLLVGTAELFAAGHGGARGCLVASALVTCAPDHEALARDLAAQRTAAQEVIGVCLDRGIASGELSPETDRQVLAAFYAAVIQGLSVQARDGASATLLRAVALQAMAAWPGGHPDKTKPPPPRKGAGAVA